eukprot:scaffold520031_cov37-Prasinocladus_malaysianus.AAC.1
MVGLILAKYALAALCIGSAALNPLAWAEICFIGQVGSAMHSSMPHSTHHLFSRGPSSSATPRGVINFAMPAVNALYVCCINGELALQIVEAPSWVSTIL